MGLAHREIDPETQRVSGWRRECGILCGWFLADRGLPGRCASMLPQIISPASKLLLGVGSRLWRFPPMAGYSPPAAPMERYSFGRSCIIPD